VPEQQYPLDPASLPKTIALKSALFYPAATNQVSKAPGA
jgi:hypothetical protein